VNAFIHIAVLFLCALVPVSGSAQTFTDLLGGNIQMAFDAPLASLPHLSVGKLRVLGTTGRNRLPQLPDVPTFMEQGVPNYDLELRWGTLDLLGKRGVMVASSRHGHWIALCDTNGFVMQPVEAGEQRMAHST
jgi:hypothetical protein